MAKMVTRVLRHRPRINYYEPEEPSFDDYLYCERCSDYVLEYCAIHGPLLVIPDDKVPSTPEFPSFVPHAALTIPHVFLHLAPSVIPGAGIGVFSTLTLPCGVRFGPYLGNRTDSVDSSYCWQIYDHNNKPSHVLDAADPQISNWLRYVNCSRHRTEQNLVAYQYRGQLYYRTIKIIPRFTELLVFYGSEFANALGVNLSKYNDVPYYKRLINPPKKAEVTSRTCTDSEYPLLGNDETIISQKLTNSDELYSKNVLINDNAITAIDGTVSEQNLVDFMDVSKEVIKDDQRFECEHCNKSFKKKAYLRTHMLSHLPTPKYQCPYCSYGTSLTYLFKRHISIHSKQNVLDFTAAPKKTDKSIVDQNFKCEHCKIYFIKKDYLNTHLLSHITTPKYQCAYCSYTTSLSHSFQKHLVIHFKDNVLDFTDASKVINKGEVYENFQCDHCKKYFLKKRYLKTHILSHLPIPKYQCPYCSYGTSVSFRFKSHVLTHSNANVLELTKPSKETIINNFDQRFLCEICNQSFFIETKLKKHLLSHLTTPKYQCPECSYTTSLTHSFKRHYLTHSKPVYSCEMCPYTTKIMRNFITHSSRHKKSLRKSYCRYPKQCEVCPFNTCSRSSFQAHMLKHKSTINISMPIM